MLLQGVEWLPLEKGRKEGSGAYMDA